MAESSRRGLEEDAPRPKGGSGRRESSRYRVEIPSRDDHDHHHHYKTASPRRTRSDLPRRSHTTRGKRDDFSDLVGTDYPTGARNNIEVAHSSSFPKKKKEKKDSLQFDEEEQIILHDTPSDVKIVHSSPRRESSRRPQSERSSSHRGVTHQAHHEHGKRHKTKESTSSPSSTKEEHSDRKSKKSKSSSSNNNNKKSLSVELVDNDEPLVPKRHFACMPFGHARTYSAISLMVAGIILAVFAKRSTSFVTLATPLELTPHMEPVTDVGLVRLNLCYSDDYSDKQVAMPYMNSVVNVEDTSTSRSVPHSSCYTVRLEADIIEDTMWQVSRVAASLSIALGAFFCLLLITTIRWESIKMKPVAVGLLVTYLLQSFSFFFYDSALCREHVCKLGAGTYLSIVASFCWFGASMVCILMDVHHTRKMRRLARLERRRRRRLRKQAKLSRKASTGTTKTETSSSGSDSQHSLDDYPAVVVEEDVEDGEWKV